MRRLPVLLFAAALAGCAPPKSGPRESAPAGPLAQPEEPLTARNLPGELAAPWPIAIAQAGGRYLLPWQDEDGLHARIVGQGGETDLALGPGAWLGAAARGDDFVVAISRGSQVIVRFLDGESGQEVAATLDGAPIQAVACDGDAVLVLGTRQADTDGSDGQGQGMTGPGAPFVEATLIRPSGPEPIALGLRATVPTLYGDESGFVVDGAWLLSAGFERARAPGPQVPGLRLFRRTGPSGDAVTVDGARWLELDAPLDGAFADPAGLELVVGGRLLHVGAGLTVEGAPVEIPLAASGRAFLRGVNGGRALWETLDGSDHLFALLDRATLAPASPLARVPAPFSRTVVTALGDQDTLLAWLADGGQCRYALWPR